jgi:hypothetical protein
MRPPSEPVTLSVEEVHELKQKLSELRHDVNNSVALMLAAIEMMRQRPEKTASLLDSCARQPPKITEAVLLFSKALESALRITKS